MKKKPFVVIPRFYRVVFALLCLGFLTSCFRVSADELYTLPRASDEFFKLQMRVDEVMAGGAEYSPPSGGEHRQSVQLVDIDGDGTNEAVAFFVFRSGDNPLKIYIYTAEGDYEVAGIIEGIGSGIESVRYVDLDGDGNLELVVGWQISSALKTVGIYSLRTFQMLAQADYSALTVADITGDGLPDLCVARIGSADTTGMLEVYSLMPDGEVISSSAHMSEGVESVSQLTAGRLRDGKPAVFLDGKVADGTKSDIFCFSSDILRNIVRGGTYENTPRTLAIAAADINGDGIMEVPYLQSLPQQTDTTYYVIEWCTFSSSGTRSEALTTYHNYSDGWYLEIPKTWKDQLTIRREDVVRGERTVVFSFVGSDGDIHDFLRIYLLSGDNRSERARLQGRFILREEGDKIYAAAFFDPGEKLPENLDTENLKKNFNLIYSLWAAGS